MNKPESVLTDEEIDCIEREWECLADSTTMGLARKFEQTILAKLADKVEPVAVVGNAFQLLWTGGSSFAEHASKHGIKVGSCLYTSPPTTAALVEAAENMPEFIDGPEGAQRPDVWWKRVEKLRAAIETHKGKA